MSFWECEDPKNYQHLQIKFHLIYKSLTCTTIYFLPETLVWITKNYQHELSTEATHFISSR